MATTEQPAARQPNPYAAADAALLAARRAVLRHRCGEGPAPTARQLALLADPAAVRRLRGAWCRAGWPTRLSRTDRAET